MMSHDEMLDNVALYALGVAPGPRGGGRSRARAFLR